MTGILLVDDDPDLRRLCQEMIGKMGYTVESVGSGKEALEWLERERPALVLLDIMMEPMDGWEVLGRMRAIEGRRDVPVIALTGRMPTPGEVLEYGGQLHRFIMKPIRRRDLERKIREFFEDLEEITARTREARERGVDEDRIMEYVALRHLVRVTGDMLGYLEQALEHGGGRNGKELDDIRELLTRSKARLAELEAELGDIRLARPGRTCE
ncbi:MAG: response regulator [Methanoculleaceae archaeon]